MGYSKKTFDGSYLSWYTTISSHGASSVKDLYSYDVVSPDVANLNWRGKNRNSINNNVSSIDQSCQNYYNVIKTLISKTKVVNGPFLENLSLLKSKIAEYNKCVEEYNSLCDQLESALAALAKEGKKNG